MNLSSTNIDLICIDVEVVRQNNVDFWDLNELSS